MKTIQIWCILLCLPSISLAQKQNLDENKVAVQKYDVVAYLNGYAVQGKDQISVMHNGAKYYFFSESNKKQFLSNPTKYEPAYGGWCAYAMGYDGSFVEVDPTSFKVINGKTYLFYKSFVNDTRAKWNKDEGNLLKKANTNWLNHQK